MKTCNNADLLTAANLNQHDLAIDLDNKQYTTGLIREEGMLKFQSAHGQAYHDVSSDDSSDCPLCATRTAETDLANLVNTYRPTIPSSATPITRFCTMSTADDASALFAKIHMEQSGIDPGALGMLEARHNAALAVAADFDRAMNVPPSVPKPSADSQSDTMPQEMPDELQKQYRRARTLPTSQRAVERAIITRRRRDEGQEKGSKKKQRHM